ncbi:MAG TPA: alpha/beta hydrolase domain-containing protein [Aliidongia sp.]|uniref:alpha/beta hydrolase domain-containing protein n=1 Tax=Aliidongia sp. TaxID=1914230 RepID=UPI002DDD3AB6|nr:alpha/beta hydrolase domain-containing protein [Aliidongia sp.]HEV2674642.1 alpha/beta hydrolase domain-containing protein [Aliidongia sp.]
MKKPCSMSRPLAGSLAASLITLVGLAPTANARVTGIVLGAPTQPYGTTGFGTTGAYEELDGVANGEIDPRDPVNAVIQDIDLAPRNARGMVEYTTNISILKPVDESKGNHTLLFEIVNRGNKLDPGFYNVGATTANPAGDGFLEQQGFTLVWAGWQPDLLPLPGLVTMKPVIAHQHNGGTITGVVRSEFILGTAATTQNILADSSSNTPGYATVTLDNSHDTMTMRVHQDDPKVKIPNGDWAYGDCTSVPFPGTPNAQKVCLKNGFDTNHIYELVYTAKDPIVMGLGLAAIRDVGSFLRHARHDEAGTPNPLAGAIKYSLLNGISQSGRLLRTFLDLGFNQDERRRQVYDGMQPHIGSVRNYMNVRFAQPGRLAGTQHTEKQYPGPEAPATYEPSFDPLAGQFGGLFDRCRQSETCPKVVHTMSDIEYWQASGAADTTDPTGTRDERLPRDVRIYEFSSTQHGGFSPVAALPTSTGICQQLPNTNSYTYNIRALLVALQHWVAKGTEPPDSDHSNLAHRSLVPLNRFVFPAIPTVTDPHGIFNTRTVYFRGFQYDAPDLSGIIAVEPPIPVRQYPALVPQVDADGNDIDGVRSVTLRAPLGTYTGWNVRKAGFSEGDACDLTGGWVPFALTEAQRRQAHDPRPSLQERYGTLAAYAKVATAAANTLVGKGELLSGDAAAAIASATAQAHALGLN